MERALCEYRFTKEGDHQAEALAIRDEYHRLGHRSRVLADVEVVDGDLTVAIVDDGSKELLDGLRAAEYSEEIVWSRRPVRVARRSTAPRRERQIDPHG
jgi:hypothetical protein